MHRFGGILRFEARDILPRRRTSKSIELSRSSRTIFRKAKHEKPRQFYLRSYLLHLFPRSIPSLSLPFFSLALKHELLHLTHIPCPNTRILSRCTRLDIDANAVSHSVSTREGESRFSTIRYQSFAFKVFSSLCFAPIFCSAQKRTFNRVERGNFRGLSRERCYSRGNSNIAFWSKTEFWSRAPWMLL